MQPGDEEFAAWFRLLETPGIGRGQARRLLAACGSPQAIWHERSATLKALVGAAAADALTREPDQFGPRLAAAMQWWQGAPQRHVLTLDHPAWPAPLLQTADPPLLLYAEGDLQRLAAPALAIVGSRHATPQGEDNARAFARALGEHGYVVVSGLARGIDAAAHEGALQGPAGTLAVVGTGLDQVYPAGHRRLAQRIAGHGVLLSEFAPGTPPLREHFPLRNRIIAGLTQGTLVVEAAVQSGSLITARLALENGREVFAVPGSIHAPQSRGCHALIKQGAKLVESAADILEELRGAAPGPTPTQPQGELPLQPLQPLQPQPTPHPLLDALGHDPVTLDALIARTGWPAPELSTRLLELELDGQVSRLPGGLYQRRFAG